MTEIKKMGRLKKKVLGFLSLIMAPANRELNNRNHARTMAIHADELETAGRIRNALLSELAALRAVEFTEHATQQTREWHEKGLELIGHGLAVAHLETLHAIANWLHSSDSRRDVVGLGKRAREITDRFMSPRRHDELVMTKLASNMLAETPTTNSRESTSVKKAEPVKELLVKLCRMPPSSFPIRHGKLVQDEGWDRILQLRDLRYIEAKVAWVDQPLNPEDEPQAPLVEIRRVTAQGRNACNAFENPANWKKVLAWIPRYGFPAAESIQRIIGVL